MSELHGQGSRPPEPPPDFQEPRAVESADRRAAPESEDEGSDGLRPSPEFQAFLDEKHQQWDQNLADPDHQPDVWRPSQTEGDGPPPNDTVQSFLNEKHQQWDQNLADPDHQPDVWRPSTDDAGDQPLSSPEVPEVPGEPLSSPEVPGEPLSSPELPGQPLDGDFVASGARPGEMVGRSAEVNKSDDDEQVDLVAAQNELGPQPGHSAHQVESLRVEDVTGGRVRPYDVYDVASQDTWAEEAYSEIRADSNDVGVIASHLASTPRESGAEGFTEAEIGRVKNHLLSGVHPIEDYETGEVVNRRFDPDPEIAEAWLRLQTGDHLPSDVVLLEHELAEIGFLEDHSGTTYQQAHRFANETHDWQSLIEEDH